MALFFQMSSAYHPNDSSSSNTICVLKSAKGVQKKEHKNWPGLSDRTILEVPICISRSPSKDGCQIKRKASG
jgi:hypothetical protein